MLLLTQSTFASRVGDMEKLERSEFTKAGELANERFISAVVGGDRYPAQTAVIAADAPDFTDMLADSVRENRPVAVVYPNGLEVVAAPATGALALLGAALLQWALSRLGRAKAARRTTRPSEEIDLPPRYHVEFRTPVPLV